MYGILTYGYSSKIFKGVHKNKEPDYENFLKDDIDPLHSTSLESAYERDKGMLFIGGACYEWIENEALQQPSVCRKVTRDDHFVCVGKMAALFGPQGDFEEDGLVEIGNKDRSV